MINFLQEDKKAQEIAIHYAKVLHDEYAEKIVSNGADITTENEAEAITQFYWRMVDLAVEDQEQDKEIAGIYDLEYWMEKLLNIFMGHMNRIGRHDCWLRASNTMNGR